MRNQGNDEIIIRNSISIGRFAYKSGYKLNGYVTTALFYSA